MNRQDRRSMMKSGVSKETVDRFDKVYNQPCTITEAVQIARGVCEDALVDYHNRDNHIRLAMSLQLDVLKKLLIDKGLITEDDFRNTYVEKALELEQMQKEKESLSSNPNMELKVNDIDINTQTKN